MAIPDIRESWGIEETTAPTDFAAEVYAARFNFVSGSRGYIGDPFILQGSHLSDNAASMLQ